MSMAGDDLSSSLLQQIHFEAILSHSPASKSAEKVLFKVINLLKIFLAFHDF